MHCIICDRDVDSEIAVHVWAQHSDYMDAGDQCPFCKRETRVSRADYAGRLNKFVAHMNRCAKYKLALVAGRIA